jgi:hypothetical protein
MLGCARGPGSPSAEGLRAWLTAQAHDDPRAGYRMLSYELQRTLSPEQFAARWRASAEERRAQTAALASLATQPAEERATGLWADGAEAKLVRETAGWRMSTARITSSGAASPEDAILRFTAALERHDLDGLLDLIGDPLRTQVERELMERLQRLKGALHKEIQVNDNRARLRLDERYYLDLTRENGRWRVSDFN